MTSCRKHPTLLVSSIIPTDLPIAATPLLGAERHTYMAPLRPSMVAATRRVGPSTCFGATGLACDNLKVDSIDAGAYSHIWICKPPVSLGQPLPVRPSPPPLQVRSRDFTTSDEPEPGSEGGAGPG